MSGVQRERADATAQGTLGGRERLPPHGSRTPSIEGVSSTMSMSETLCALSDTINAFGVRKCVSSRIRYGVCSFSSVLR